MKPFAKKFKTNVLHKESDDTLATNKESLSQGSLAIFINNPGLHHITEEIFWNLKSKAMENCQQINHSSSQILGKS